MFFHQYHNSVGDDLYNCFFHRNARWSLHYHRGYELVVVTSGELFARVGDQEMLLGEGEGLLVFPYQLHSYETKTHSECYITVFSGSYIAKFASACATREPKDPRFRIPSPLAVLLSAYMTGEETPTEDEVQFERPPLYAIKACLYAVCHTLMQEAEWREKREERALVFRILTYIEEHYTEDITLPEMAEALSYEYHYLSRVLREDLHIGFRSLINQRRCERARELISDGDQPLSTIAMLCGFRSLRTFNRAFLAETGITPSAMRRGARSAR